MAREERTDSEKMRESWHNPAGGLGNDGNLSVASSSDIETPNNVLVLSEDSKDLHVEEPPVTKS